MTDPITATLAVLSSVLGFFRLLKYNQWKKKLRVMEEREARIAEQERKWNEAAERERKWQQTIAEQGRKRQAAEHERKWQQTIAEQGRKRQASEHERKWQAEQAQKRAAAEQYRKWQERQAAEHERKWQAEQAQKRAAAEQYRKWQAEQAQNRAAAEQARKWQAQQAWERKARQEQERRVLVIKQVRMFNWEAQQAQERKVRQEQERQQVLLIERMRVYRYERPKETKQVLKRAEQDRQVKHEGMTPSYSRFHSTSSNSVSTSMVSIVDSNYNRQQENSFVATRTRIPSMSDDTTSVTQSYQVRGSYASSTTTQVSSMASRCSLYSLYG